MPINPNLFIPTRDFVDRQVATLTSNYYTVPTGIAFEIRLIQIPKNGVLTPPSVTDPIVVQEVNPTTDAVIRTFTPISSGTPTLNQVLIDSTTYSTGRLGFAAQTMGIRLKFIYQGLGSTLFAADINEITSGNLLKDGSIKTRHLNISDLVLSGTLTVGGAVTLSSALSAPGLTITGANTLNLGKLGADVAAIAGNVGCLYYHTVDKQYKGVADGATAGTYKVVILG